MKKILIGANNLDNFVQKDGKKLCLGPEHILTPGAKDAARNRGISLIFGQSKSQSDPVSDADNGVPVVQSAEEGSDSIELSRKIVTLLKTEFDLRDEGILQDVALAVLKRIKETN